MQLFRGSTDTMTGGIISVRIRSVVSTEEDKQRHEINIVFGIRSSGNV